MPSFEHNGLVQLLRDHPDLVPTLLAVLGVPVPAHASVQIADTALDQLTPTPLQADLVAVLRDDAGAPRLAVIVEVQRDVDDDKLFSWPDYLAQLRLRLRCDVCVLVVTPAERVARWARRPIRLGPGNDGFAVFVLGPRDMPPILDPAAAAADPALAVLTVLAHGNEAGGVPVLMAILEALPHMDRDHHPVYLHLLYAAISEPLRRALQQAIAAMQLPDVPLPEVFQQFIDTGRAEGEREGKREGKALALLTILEHRGVHFPPEQRARILACRDESEMETWLQRAALARVADDLFE